jgi:O-antigen/teichoic acid export membrane protein
LSSSWPLLVSNVTIFLLGTGIDVWILGAFRPAQEVALYGAATRLIFVVAVPFTILRSVLPPIVAELYAQGKLKQLEKTVRAVSALAGIPSFMVLVVFVLFGGDILRILFGGFYQQAAIVLSILSVGRLVAVWAGACGVVLMMTAYQRTMMYMTILSGVLSVGGGALLASRFGALGVAVATSSAIVVQNVMMVIAAKRLVGIWTHVKFSPELIRGVVRTLRRK